MSKNRNLFKNGKKFKRFWPESYSEKNTSTTGWFCLNHTLMPVKSDRRKYSGKWFKIVNSDNRNNVIYRVLRFDPTLKAENEDGSYNIIVVDWRGWLALSDEDENVKNPIPLTFTKANFFEVLFKASWNHPEPTNKLALRVAFILGGVSIVLGLIGVVIALLK